MPKPVALRQIDGKRLEALVKKANLTDVQLGQMVDTAQVGRWRKSERVPQGDRLELLCRLFGCSPSFLLGRTPEECQDYLVNAVRNEIGPDAAQVLETYVGFKRMKKKKAKDEQEPIIEAWQMPPRYNGAVSDAENSDEAPQRRRDDDARPSK